MIASESQQQFLSQIARSRGVKLTAPIDTITVTDACALIAEVRKLPRVGIRGRIKCPPVPRRYYRLPQRDLVKECRSRAARQGFVPRIAARIGA